jgi:signal transduction histidine kinase
VLIVEDSPTDAKLVERALRRAGHAVAWERVEDAEAMRAALARGPWDIVISDWSMPAFSGPAALLVLQELQVDIPFIIVSGTVGEDSAVEAMRLGAHDYVLKGRLARLAPAVERELRDAGDRAARRRAEESLRRSEAQLAQAQKMEAIGNLAGGIAHDFNNLLSVILSYSTMLAEDLAPDDPMRPDLEQIEAAGRQAAELTRQLLAFGRRQVLEVRLVDVNAVVARSEKMLRRLLGEDLELTVLPRARRGMTLVDLAQLEQVLLNLAVNARDAMPQGGRLTIETADAELDQDYADLHPGVRPGPYVMLAVTDTGTGMDPATQARIFEPFFTTKELGKGTGLGLATVFGVVRQSGGTIWVYSEPGRGSTFKVYLPSAGAEASAAALAEEAAPVSDLRGAETILLAEDEEQVRHLASTILRRHGYEVLEAQGGGDALLLCEQHPGTIHLLLTDVVMPRVSGRQLAERLRALRPGMKVLFMSGYPDQTVVHHGVLEAGVAFLQKPLTPDRLAARVRQVLDGPAPAAR